MHKVRWSIEALIVAAMVLALNFFKQALNPAISAQTALSQFSNSMTSQVEVVGYTYILGIATFAVAAIAIAILAVEVKSYMEKKENENEALD